MKLEELIKEFNRKEYQLKLDSEGICRMTIDDKYVLSLEKALHSEDFYLYAGVGTLPAGKEEEILKMALSGNLFGQETGKAMLGYAQDIKLLVLFDRFEEHCVTLRSFEDRFDQFIATLGYWLQKFEDKVVEVEEFSLRKHIMDLQGENDLKIFFA